MSVWLVLVGAIAVLAMIVVVGLSKRVARLEQPNQLRSLSQSALDESEEFHDAPAEMDFISEDEAGLEREQQLALSINSGSRYARNFAADMLNSELGSDGRAYGQRKYEEAKTKYLIQVQSLRDDFSRGFASHGVIDLLMAGGEIENAKRLFASIDSVMQDSIVATNPEVYDALR